MDHSISPKTPDSPTQAGTSAQPAMAAAMPNSPLRSFQRSPVSETFLAPLRSSLLLSSMGGAERSTASTGAIKLSPAYDCAHHEAAVKIQAAMRRRLAGKRAALKRAQLQYKAVEYSPQHYTAVVKLQAAARGWLARKQYEQRVLNERKTRHVQEAKAVAEAEAELLQAEAAAETAKQGVEAESPRSPRGDASNKRQLNGVHAPHAVVETQLPQALGMQAGMALLEAAASATAAHAATVPVTAKPTAVASHAAREAVTAVPAAAAAAGHAHSAPLPQRHAQAARAQPTALEHAAAKQVQAAWRGHCARRLYRSVQAAAAQDHARAGGGSTALLLLLPSSGLDEQDDYLEQLAAVSPHMLAGTISGQAESHSVGKGSEGALNAVRSVLQEEEEEEEKDSGMVMLLGMQGQAS